LAGYGVPEMALARVVRIDAKTLCGHNREELDTGQIKATAKVAENRFRKATGDGAQSVTAAIFWQKTRGGATRPGARSRDLRDLSQLADEELERMIASHPAALTDQTVI
jgi:hypothetical protein